MESFVFSTNKYDVEAQSHGATKVLIDFRKKASVEGYVQPQNMDYNSFSGNYLKIRHGNYRSVLTRKQCQIDGQEVCIYVALRMFARGADEYDKFKQTNTKNAIRDQLTGKVAINWSDYETKVRQLLTAPIIENDNPNLTNYETQFISTPLNINHELFDTTIYETKEWISSVGEVDFTDFYKAASLIENFIFEHLDSQENWYAIEFKEHAILAYKRKDENWILAKLTKKRDGSDYSDERPADIPTDFQRGYPYSYLDDPDEWRLMEQDPKSNMVLSSKQVEIVSNEIKYPLFITGRAGSGKSTLLQYIFAEVILRYINSRDVQGVGLMPPVYLSYSSNLVNDAKKLCKSLFEKNNVYKNVLTKHEINYKKDIEPSIDKMFYVFKELLIDCIEKKQPGTVRKKFPNDKYINFPKFNAMWEKKFGREKNAARDYGPSISWHVIRTYIKGWDSEAYLTPSDYDKIGEKNQSVTPKTFQSIYDKVWKNWYSKLDGNWDDQDLAIYCLQEDCVDGRFSAVFCDESQDFTRVEIDFILNSSSFAHRKVQIDDFNKMPFVFAGDEFQTLNPTGFSWDSLRSYFTERFCAFVGLQHQKGLTPDPEPLSENFRSTKNVVQLANRIQLLRATRFKEYSTPQKPHFSLEGNPIYCISPSNRTALDELIKKKVVLIVPANDGESVEAYINNSPLKDIIQFEDGVPTNITILNPMQAKGLEYPNVAVFGFDTQHNPGFKITQLIKWFDAPTNDPAIDIEMKYQISNAYVAVTRANSNLYIIDDVNSTSFWAFAYNQSEDTQLEKDVNKLQDLMLNNLSDSKRDLWNENELGWIECVDNVDISDENLKYINNEAHKHDLELRAESLQDAKLMRQAAIIHKGKGRTEDEARCRAKAANYEEKYPEAAEWFVKANLYDDAIDSYWHELNQDPTPQTIDKINELSDRSKNKKAEYCMATVAPSFRDVKVKLADMVTYLQTHLNEQGCIKAWEYVVKLMIQKIKVDGKEGVKDIPVIAKSCSELSQYDIKVDISKLAHKAYQTGAYKEAVDIWETMEKEERPREYYVAKIKVEKYPQSLPYYEGTKDPKWYSNLLSEYRKNRELELNAEQKNIICDALRKAKDSKEDFSRFLPYMLLTADSIETVSQDLKVAVVLGINVNVDVLRSIAEIRYSDLQSWERPAASYVDPEAGLLFDAVEDIKRIREGGFQSDLLSSLQSKKVKDYCGIYYKQHSRKKTARFVYPELGKAFEVSGRFFYACIYYEWASKQTDEQDLKRYFDERWIICKERQAEKDKSEQYRNEARDKRIELEIKDKEIPVEPVINTESWEKAYSEYVKVSPEIRSQPPKPEPPTPGSPNPDGITTGENPPKTDNPKSLTKQEIKFGNYSIVYFPQKNDIVIKNDEEYSVRIKNGVFPDNSEYYELKSGRLFIKDDNVQTPFFLEFEKDVLNIIIFDNDKRTGMVISFDVSSVG